MRAVVAVRFRSGENNETKIVEHDDDENVCLDIVEWMMKAVGEGLEKKQEQNKKHWSFAPLFHPANAKTLNKTHTHTLTDLL